MPDEEIKRIIELAVNATIEKYKKCGLLKDSDNVAYSDVSAILSNYYDGDKKDPEVSYAISSQRFDPYFRIIPMYFDDRKTIESIADELGVDVSTIVRNKKRLCLAIYNDLV